MPQVDQEFVRYALLGYEQEKRRIEQKIADVRAQLDGAAPSPQHDDPKQAPSGRRNLSAAARKRIAAAQKARWAAYRGEESAEERQTPSVFPKKKQGMSEKGRARIAEAQRKRWALTKKKK